MSGFPHTAVVVLPIGEAVGTGESVFICVQEQFPFARIARNGKINWTVVRIEVHENQQPTAFIDYDLVLDMSMDHAGSGAKKRTLANKMDKGGIEFG